MPAAATMATTAPAEPSVAVPVLTVIGRRAPQTPSGHASAAAAAVPQAALERPNAELTQVLRSVPGVRTVDDGTLGGRSTAAIRGADSRHTQVLLDGVPLNRAGLGAVDLDAIPLTQIERVDVYRGPTAIFAGPAAIGGTIDIQMRVPRGRSGALGVGVGSFGSYDAHGWAATPLSDTVWLLGGIVYRRSDGDFTYLSDNGTAFDSSDDAILTRGNNHAQQVDGLLKLSAFRGGWRLTLTQNAYGDWGGLPGNGLRQPTVATRGDRRSLTSLAWRHDRLSAHVALSGGAYYLWLRAQQSDPLQEFGSIPNQRDDRTHIAGAHSRLRLRTTAWLTLLPGLAIDAEFYNPYDALAPAGQLPNAERVQAVPALAAELAVHPARLKLLGAITLNAVHSDVAHSFGFGGVVLSGPPQSDVYTDGHVGVVWTATPALALKLNAATARRLPTFVELFGDSAFVVPSPGLKPERGRSLDAGVEWNAEFEGGGYLLLSAFAFISRIDDVIQFTRATSDTFVALNLDAARIVGSELGMQWDLATLVAGSLAYDLLASRQDSASPALAGKRLPLRPLHRVDARLELYRNNLGPLHRLAASSGVHAESANFVDAANTVRVPRRARWDVGLRSVWCEGRLLASLEVRNVGNNRIHDLIYYPLPGRSYHGSLAWHWL